jgi:hypothetical protein
MDVIEAMVSKVLVNIATGVIALFGAYGVYYIQKATAKVRTQTAQLKGEAERKLLTDALEDVERLAIVTVGSFEQTAAAALREAVKDGKADREELVALGGKAFEEVKAAISPKAQQVITDNLGSFDAYLAKFIENAVLEVKQKSPYITLPSALTAVDE